MSIKSWIARTFFTDGMVSKYIGSLIRHLMTALAGLLVALDMPEAAEAAERITGDINTIAIAVGIYLVAMTMSLMEKKSKAK